MSEETKEIEVEVVEIDGVAPVAVPDRADESPRREGDWPDWRQWQGKALKLDSRWWPLWVLLGLIGLVLLLTVGLVIAVVFVIVRIFVKIFRAILG